MTVPTVSRRFQSACFSQSRCFGSTSNLDDLRQSERASAVQPSRVCIGAGVAQRFRANSSAFRLKSLLPAWLLPFWAGVPAIGVGQLCARSFSVGPALARILWPSRPKLHAPLASVDVAVGQFAVTAVKVSATPRLCRIPALSLSSALAVGQFCAASCKSGPPAPRASRWLFAPPETAFAVGHAEPPEPFLRRTDFFR